MRNFTDWLNTFTDNIATYKYYVDFEKVITNADSLKVELNILNSLIGSQNIEAEFEEILNNYPEVLKCIPILIAVRKKEIQAEDSNGCFIYRFNRPNQSIEQYKYFMRETGLFDLIANHLINNIYDYVIGVETGLDSNGRKNRGGHLMEDLVESYLIEAEVDYYKEMYASEITEKWGLDLSKIINDGEADKRFDFVVKTASMIYGIETNFYTSSGSKLNETARSYKQITQEAKEIPGFTFVWITDGKGWHSAKNNLKETFDVLENIYCINDMKNGIIKEILV